MTLSDFGSVASIVSLVLTIVGFIIKTIRNRNAKKKK